MTDLHLLIFFYLNISLQQINGFKSVFFQEIVMKSLEKKLIPVALNVLFLYDPSDEPWNSFFVQLNYYYYYFYTPG